MDCRVKPGNDGRAWWPAKVAKRGAGRCRFNFIAII